MERWGFFQELGLSMGMDGSDEGWVEISTMLTRKQE